MDYLSTVFHRTANGNAKVNSPNSGLSPAFLQLLKLIDGKKTGSALAPQMRGLSPEDMSDWLAHLERQGLIETEADASAEGLDFTAMFDKAPPSGPKLTKEQQAQLKMQTTTGMDVLQKTGSFMALKAPASWEKEAAPAQRKVSDYRILVVEDDDTQAMFVQKLLLTAGFLQSRAANREEIVAALNQIPAPDCILMDVELPGLSGFDVLARVRQHPRLKAVPVIMLTAHATHEFVMKGLSLGANGYLAKPIKKQILLDSISQILNVSLPPG